MHHGCITFTEVAQRLERRSETVADLLAKGCLPAVRLVSGETVVPVSAVWPYRQVSESDE